ncbi:uncharacterized protein EKO05_0006146 [Ascochyta rabiei]|uniref:uncharacterized protein n=1 Tax=Didymella rabiei TaxID=5454 RepID=UPI0021FA7FE7|nr:uncharacterized protein EKO05_0006146 [Ascochyta rabiei]UPX15706.1 hypothetical protein EKO05_0006146 [Ascochyta rabiei]
MFLISVEASRNPCRIPVCTGHRTLLLPETIVEVPLLVLASYYRASQLGLYRGVRGFC